MQEVGMEEERMEVFKMKIKIIGRYDICDLTYAEYRAIHTALCWYVDHAKNANPEAKRVMDLFDKRQYMGLPNDSEFSGDEDGRK